VGLVGDRERDSAADAVRSAYARGYLTHQELSERLDEALSARSSLELSSSVRGLPGGVWLMLSAPLRPFLSAQSQSLRRRAGAVLRRLAIGIFAATSAVLLLGLGLWTVAAGLSTEVALGFLVIWIALSALPLLMWRGSRRLLR
jgi:hypothetical protein